MSVFFEYPTDLGSKSQGPILATAFSNGEQHVMAVATKNGDVTLFLEEGEHMDPDVTLHRPGECSKLHWHPRLQLLAGGWDDGTVTVWGDKERVMREESNTHKAPITLLTFSPDGSRLISGDANGLLVVWAVDHRGRLQVACKYEKKGSITHLVFRSPAQLSVPADGSPLSCPSFFFGGSSGIVVFADDLNHSSDVIKAGSPIGSMYYSAARDYLVLVTIDVVLYKYKITPEGKMTQERKVKLSIKGDGSELQTVFAGHGLLAAANGENLVRLWHLESDDNYTLSLLDPRHQSIPKDIITCLAFNHSKRILVGGTLAGRVVFWKFIGRSGGGDPSASDWEVLPPVETNYGGSGSGLGIRSLVWGGGSSGSSAGGGSSSIGPAILGVASKEGISVMNETVMACAYNARSGASIIQLSSEAFALQVHGGRSLRVETNIRIKGFALSDKHVLVWNGKRAEVRELPPPAATMQPSTELRVVSSFATKAQVAVLSGESIYACVGGRIEVLSLAGVFKNALAFTEAEGVPVFLALSPSAGGEGGAAGGSTFMACATNHNVLKLWDISRREPKNIVPGRHFSGSAATPAQQQQQALDASASNATSESDLRGMQLRHLSINCTGTKVGILADMCREEHGALRAPDSRVHVYDVELDRVFSHEFGPEFYPVRACWDGQMEPKLLVVETKKFELPPRGRDDKDGKDKEKGGKDKEKASTSPTNAEKRPPPGAGEDEEDEGAATSTASGTSSPSSQLPLAEVTTLFATSDYGVLMQDSFAIHASSEALLALDVPSILFMARPSSNNPNGAENDTDYDDQHGASTGGGVLPHVKKRTMRDFMGLESVEAEVRRDLLNFSYFLTVGNMDEAYRAVKKIHSTNVWSNMAHSCVKSRRLDVAEVCLGNMGNARGAKAVREARAQHPEKEAAVAMLAIQLNLLDDAERLYKECGRYDLLVQLYMASGRWKDALKAASQHDRIHLKSTHYQYARHLEHVGDTQAAITHYELSDTHKHEVPRMLFDSQHIGELEAYIKASQDKQLIKWWAQYCESNGAYDDAVRYYDQAGETLALVRVLCYRGEDEKAAKVCVERGDLAACYHLARQYEQQQRIGDAIHFFKLARRYNHGVRLAREHFLDGELMSLALESSSPQLKVEAAKFFEEKQDFDKAVLLYQKGGRVARALELCFKGELFDSLVTISEALPPDSTDPRLFVQCAEFFLAAQPPQYARAANLFIQGKQVVKALTLCMKHGVHITEAMAERMTPPKTKDERERAAREDILKKLAHCCKDQGEFHLACKKYTQAGDHVRAMKCLLKSADTEKITYYATMTKQKDIYILAANYLQNLDWHNDPAIMARIIEFYSKAKAMQQLATFYDACAQVEIDEYRDYEKALGALQDSQKFILKGKDIPQREEKLANLDGRIRLVQRFVDARKCVKSNPDEMVRLCNSILDAGDVEAAIRVGDVYALLIEYFHSVGEYAKAYQVIERMRGAGIILSPYLDNAMVTRIHQEVGQPMVPEGQEQQQQQQWGHEQQQQQGGDDDIGEDIAEDM